MWTRSCLRWTLAGLPLFLGCAMCQGPDVDTYSAVGGRWQRTDACYGRVGSAFTPEVGTRVETAPATAEAAAFSQSMNYPIEETGVVQAAPVGFQQSNAVYTDTVYIDELPPPPVVAE